MSITETRARARRTDPKTSHAAAATVDVHSHREQVVALLREADRPLAHHELVHGQQLHALRDGWPPASASSIRSRTAALAREGLVRAVDDISARTPYGRHTLRWELVPDDEVTS